MKRRPPRRSSLATGAALSVVAHVVMLWGAWWYASRSGAAADLVSAVKEREPIEFVFVDDDPSKPPETPSEPDKRYSDRDRRGAQPSPMDETLAVADPTSHGASPDRTPVPPSRASRAAQPSPPAARTPSRPTDRSARQDADRQSQAPPAPHGAEAASPPPAQPGLPGPQTNPKVAGARISEQLNRMMQAASQPGFKNPNTRALTGGDMEFDTSLFDFGPYARIVRQIVRSNWHPPESMLFKGYCRVRFRIQKDGRVTDLKLHETSGVPSYDESTLNAMRSSHLPPLPEGFTEDSVGVTFTFLYNMGPEEIPRPEPVKR